jgi:hypothetical protein
MPEVSPVGGASAALPITSPPVSSPRMSELPPTAALPADIEARQDDLLRQLDALEKRIDRVLAEYAAAGPARGVTAPIVTGISDPAVAVDPPGVVLPFSATVVAAAR